MKSTLIIALVLFCFAIQAQDQEYEQFILESSLPNELRSSIYKAKFLDKFILNGKLNPYYIRGDFNGDGNLDYAISVVNKLNRKSGIAIFLDLDKPTIIGAGESLINRNIDDFTWMDAWQVYPKKNVELGVGETTSINLLSEAILVIKTESSSGIIYWDGKYFKWYQQGD